MLYTHIQDREVIFISIIWLTPFLLSTAQPYSVEFYFDTPNPVRILKGNNYSYNLQWTQKDPEATDRIIGYCLKVRKVKLSDTKC